MPRRWKPNDSYLGEGWAVRVTTGKKPARRENEEDLVMWLQTTGWTRISMDLLFVAVDFLTENEDVLFPPELGFRGGKMLTSRLHMAATRGYAEAVSTLREEKDKAALKREQLAFVWDDEDTA